MKFNALTAALLVAATAAHATNDAPSNVPSASANAHQEVSPTATAGALAGSNSGSSAGVNNNTQLGASSNASPTISPQVYSGGANVTSDNDSRSLSLGFPPPSQAARLPAIRCRSTSQSWSAGWSLVTRATSDADVDGVCQAADLAAVLIAQCQHLSAQQVLNVALRKAYPGVEFVLPADAKNAPSGRCDAPAPVVDPKPAPAPVPPVVTPRTPERISLKAGALFDFGKADLKPSAQAELDVLAQKLRAARAESVAIVGHTDGIGSEAYNDDLSARRAAAVRVALALRGVSPAIIASEGRGKREPVADNRTAAGRELNRRVTVDVFAAN